MEPDRISARIGELFSHRRWIILNGVSANTQPVIDLLREWGGSEFLVVAGETGVGDQPDVPCVFMPSPPGTVMEGFRRFAARVADPPTDVRETVARFDPDETARVLGGLFALPSHFLGRRVYGVRPQEWERLEDKTRAEEIWDEAGIRHAPVALVSLAGAPAAHRELAGVLGTVWAADNTGGWHGGGERTRWVADDAGMRSAIDDLDGVRQVRVMPFLDGIPCSIHGVVLADGVAALRPVELVILRRQDRRGFVYAGVANTWDPSDALAGEMRTAARRVGEVLRRRHGHRGPFSIDGVATADGFRPTELNPRFSVGYGIQAATVPDLHGAFLVRAVVEGDLDVSAPWLEDRVLRSTEENRSIRMGVPVEGRRTFASMKLVISDGVVRSSEEGDDLELGPSPAGSFMFWKVSPASVPQGSPFAPYAAQAIRLAAESWNLPIPPVEAASASG